MVARHRYDFFRENAGGRVGYSAVDALALARAEERAEDLLAIVWEEEYEMWDGDCDPPNHCLMAACLLADDVDEYHGTVRNKNARSFAALGMIGVDSMRDPYLRVVSAELYSEALAVIDAERDEQATALASEMAERATYACGGLR